MNRRQFLNRAAAAIAAGAVPSVFAADAPPFIGKISKTNDEWRVLLTPAQFNILREEGTERPFSSPLNEEKRKGTFVCAGCALPLFESSTKFESGTGWPSFYDVLKGRVDTRVAHKLIYPRTEYHCARCAGHQGHVFDDGPRPNGLRYCHHGVALKFIPA